MIWQRRLDYTCRFLIGACLCLWLGSGCVPNNSKIDQSGGDSDRHTTSGPALDAPENHTGPQAATANAVAANVATSVQNYMPWTLLILLAFNLYIHNWATVRIATIHADQQRHTIDRLASLANQIQDKA